MGKVHWEITGLKSPSSAQRLENGNTLVSEITGSRVAEWDRDGKIIWQHTGLQNARTAQRFSNGNTLITDLRGVRVVNRQGKIIWQKRMKGVVNAIRY